LRLTGQVAGRIDSIKPVKQIIDETVQAFHHTIADMAKRYPAN
jgi:enoyl-[acyl-carrier protein] reductase II